MISLVVLRTRRNWARDAVSGAEPNGDELQDMTNEMEAEANETTDFPEFLSVMTRKMKVKDTEEELVGIFKVLNRDETISSTLQSHDTVRSDIRAGGSDAAETETVVSCRHTVHAECRSWSCRTQWRRHRRHPAGGARTRHRCTQNFSEGLSHDGR